MAGYTKNFNLKLPSDIEFYDIEDFNENFEKIDQMAVKKGEGIGELTGGALSDRPEPGIAGRYYFAQDTGEIFLDTGEEWVLAAASQKELAAHLADNVKHISNEERLTWNKAAQDAQPYKIFKSNKDANGIFTVVEYRREDDTLFMRSVLSNPDANGNYQTATWTYYDTDGTTVVETKVWTITRDADGDITSIA